MLILALHIAVAFAMTVSTVGVASAAYAGRAVERVYRTMIASFTGTVLSGVLLVVIAPAGLGRFCAMMTAFSAMTLFARHYYRRRVLIRS